MQEQRLKIFNANIITPAAIIKGGCLLVTGNTITEISQFNIDAGDSVSIDACGQYLSPGFIDIHVHGGGGSDFMDGNIAAFLTIANTHVRYGTTAMLPTTLTSSKEDMIATLAIYEAANTANTSGSQFLGMHLEGPYFAMSQRGAQDPKYIRNPDPGEYHEILAATSAIKRWSAAPELPGALEFGRYLRTKSILPAIAHTDAIYEEVVPAFESGYSLATHLYSAMSGVTRRNAFRFAGVVEAAFLIDEMDVEIIADGVHLPAPLLKLVYKIKGSGKTALITDAMRAAGMPPGESVLGNINTGLKVIVEDGVAKLPDRTSFAGSVSTTDRLVRTMIEMGGVSVPEAVKMMTSTPATILGIAGKKGEIMVGKDADLVIFDENITIAVTIIKGKIVYQKA